MTDKIMHARITAFKVAFHAQSDNIGGVGNNASYEQAIEAGLRAADIAKQPKDVAAYRYPWRGKYAYYGPYDTVQKEAAEASEPLFTDGNGITHYRAQVVGMKKALDRIDGYMTQNAATRAEFAQLSDVRGIIYMEMTGLLRADAQQHAEQMQRHGYELTAGEIKVGDELIYKEQSARTPHPGLKVVQILYDDKGERYYLLKKDSSFEPVAWSAVTVEANYRKAPKTPEDLDARPCSTE